ncbi:MAG TPA: hypothetical protein VGC66_22750 [Pyrinomonadaceae bacterium]|jgi:hypothetical protein
MYITVQLDKEAALALQGQQPETDASRQIIEAANELGATLKPMHPGTADPDLASYFFVEVPDAATAERVISRLSRSSAITAAYLKPPDELP